MKKNKLYYLVVDFLIVAICFSVFLFSYFSSDNKFIFSEDKAIYNGNKKNNNISIMINVYWGTEFLNNIMDILLEKDADATFFVGGCWAVEYTNMLQKIVINGFEIGSHGYSHLDHDKISYEDNVEEIISTHKIVQALTGKSMNLFAPPSGAYNKNTLDACKTNGYKTIMWSKDTIDWRDKDTELIYSRATKNLSNGDLILMHPTKNTLEALPRIIDTIKANGFNLVNVSTNIAE